jgi:hypothetical protein
MLHYITVVIDADDETTTRIYDALNQSFPFGSIDVVKGNFRVPFGGSVSARKQNGSYDFPTALLVRHIVDAITQSGVTFH